MPDRNVTASETRRGHERGHPQRNKQNAQAFYDVMFNQSRPAEAIATYVGATYRQHNRTWGTASRPSSTTSSGWQPSTQGKRVEFKRALAEGDYVVLH
jgi:predicted SnoaL-like aldol condensation-catalyzing enzyme